MKEASNIHNAIMIKCKIKFFLTLLLLGFRCCLSLASLYARFASLHINRLNKVDFPALGGPNIDTVNFSSAEE